MLRHPFGQGLLLFITEGIIHRPFTMGQVIIQAIIMVRLAFGSPATGQIDGLPMVGKGLGSRGIGNIADK